MSFLKKIANWLLPTLSEEEEIPEPILDTPRSAPWRDQERRVVTTPVGTYRWAQDRRTVTVRAVSGSQHWPLPPTPRPEPLPLYRGSALSSTVARSRTSGAATKRAANLVLGGNWQAALAGLEEWVAAHPAKDLVAA